MTHEHPMLPVFAVVLGIAIFSVMDGFMKSASIEGGVYLALLARSVIGSAIMLPVWALAGGRVPGREAASLHMLRSAVVTGMALLFFWGLVRLPMAEAMALSFIAPLIALYLAAVMLGEIIRPAAVIASLFGLAGVGVIASAHFGADLRAGSAVAGIGAVLASAVLYAWNLVLQRRQALVAGPVEVALAQHLFVGLYLLLAAPWLVSAPTPPLVRDAAFAAVLAAISLMLLSWAYGRAEAQRLVPFEYTGFVWAALFGWLRFGERVTWVTLGGTALILTGCWIGTRKAAEKGRAP